MFELVSAYINVGYGTNRDVTGSFSMRHKENNMRVEIPIDKQDGERIKAVLYELFERTQPQIAADIRDTQLQPLLGYDKERTIDYETPAAVDDDGIVF